MEFCLKKGGTYPSWEAHTRIAYIIPIYSNNNTTINTRTPGTKPCAKKFADFLKIFVKYFEIQLLTQYKYERSNNLSRLIYN